MTPSEFQMSEAAPAAAGIAGHKVLLFGLPFVAVLMAWWLGLRAYPPKPGREWKDLVDRLMACAVSSFAVGLPVMLALHAKAPWVFSSAVELAAMAELPPMVGFFGVVSCVGLLCSLPGPWLLVAFLRWFERRKGKDLGQMAGDAAQDVRRVMNPDRQGGPEQ